MLYNSAVITKKLKYPKPQLLYFGMSIKQTAQCKLTLPSLFFKMSTEFFGRPLLRPINITFNKNKNLCVCLYTRTDRALSSIVVK